MIMAGSAPPAGFALADLFIVAIVVRDLLGLKTEIIGVQATGAPAYARSFAEGRVVALNRAETCADGVAVRQPDADALKRKKTFLEDDAQFPRKITIA